MNNKTRFPVFIIVITILLTLLIAGGAAWFLGYLGPKFHQESARTAGEKQLYTCGMHPEVIREKPGNCPLCGMKLVPVKKGAEASPPESGKGKIAYWRAPMNPNEIYDKPGKSAMGMDLVPVYEDQVKAGATIVVDPVTQQDMGLRTAVVEKGPLVHTIRTYGHVTYDETLLAVVNLTFSGWIEKLYVDFTGQRVEKGKPLFDIYSPDLITVQQDYLEAWRNYQSNKSDTFKQRLNTVRKRLSFYNISDAEIEKIKNQNQVLQTITIYSPVSGVVIEKHAVEGGYIKAGSSVYEIADLSKVWVEAHIFEYEFQAVHTGLPVEMTLPYMPGRHYTGEVLFIYPYLQRKTRDVVVRLTFDNPENDLKPDMYADVKIRTSVAKEGIRIPEEAVIRSGERNIVFVTREKGKFIPREVTLGMPLDNGMIQILSGVAPGETIVTSGQFLLDSESKLKEAIEKMREPQPQTQKQAAPQKPAPPPGFFDELKKEPPPAPTGFFKDLKQMDNGQAGSGKNASGDAR